MSDFDQRDVLTRELRDRAEDVGGHPIGFDTVRRSARGIARRRRIVAGAVAAAVVAVAVPTTLAVTDGLDRGQDPIEQPNPTVTKTAAPRPDGPVRLTLDGLPRGVDPQIGYIRGESKELVTPSGTQTMPIAMQGIAPYADGWIALGYDSGGEEMFFLDNDMSIADRFPAGSQSFVVSPDGSQVAYVRTEEGGRQTLVNAPASGAEPETWTVPAFPAIEPVGFVSADTVLYQTVGARQRSMLATAGGETTELEGFVKATDANMSTGLVAGQTQSLPDVSGCFGVLDPAGGTGLLWETCDYSISEFSPDGRYVLASDPYLSGLGRRSISILDAQTGDLVLTYQPDRNAQIAMTQVVWEDSDNALAIAMEGSTWTMLRMSTAGELQEAIEPLRVGPYGDFPFWFASMS